MSSQPIKPCMGGFCARREKCAHHVDPTDRVRPAERLCTPGAEAVMFFLPLQPAKQLEAA